LRILEALKATQGSAMLRDDRGIGGGRRVVLRATHEAALAYCTLADLKRFAVDLA
jgi:hypothetical protein